MKLLKSLFLGLLLGLIILFVLALTISIIYEKEVAQYFVEELNEKIDVKIDVEEVNFSLLRKFPNASLEFKSVIAHKPTGFAKKIKHNNTDTLFAAKRLFLEFNILDFLSKDYTIKNIHFDQGTINVFIDQNGNENYRFWEPSENKSNEVFKLELSKVKITNTKVLYCNDYLNVLCEANIETANFKGLFYKKNFTLDIKSVLIAKDFTFDNYNYISNKSISLKLLLDINQSAISFSAGDITIESFKLGITGDILKHENTELNLAIVSHNQSFEKLLAILPTNFRNEFSGFRSKEGLIDFKSTINGVLSQSENPKIQGVFQLKKTNLIDTRNNIRLNQVYADGEFSNGKENHLKTTSLKFNSFSATLDNCTANGAFMITDFTDPYLTIDYSAYLDFADLKKNFSIDTLEVLSGTGKIKGLFSGNLGEIKNLRFYDFFKKEFAFNLLIKNGQFKLKGNPLVVSNVSGRFAINETLYTDSLYFKILDNDFSITGEATNLYNYFSSDGSSSVVAELNSESIDLNQLSPLFFVEKSSKKDPSYKFPDRLNLFLNIRIGAFSVGKFDASEVKGSLNYKPKMFSLHEISFNSMNGWSKIGGVVIQNYKNDFIVRVQSNLRNIDIKMLFYSFNSFGQTFLPEKNIKGDISGDIFFSASLSEKLDIDKKSIIAESNILIQNGALINYEPLKRLSRFIDVKELEQITFSALQNQITIKDEKVIIPKMDIISSAINISISGTHNFNNTFEYRFRVLLSDLLAKKAKAKAKKDNEFENIEDDDLGKTNVYLKITGTPDNYKVSYDRKQARQAIKEDFRNEKQALKKILNEEFGWFKKDSTVLKDTIKAKKNNSFRIEWDENTEVKEKSKQEKREDHKFEIIFDEDTTSVNGN